MEHTVRGGIVYSERLSDPGDNNSDDHESVDPLPLTQPGNNDPSQDNEPQPLTGSDHNDPSQGTAQHVHVSATPDSSGLLGKRGESSLTTMSMPTPEILPDLAAEAAESANYRIPKDMVNIHQFFPDIVFTTKSNEASVWEKAQQDDTVFGDRETEEDGMMNDGIVDTNDPVIQPLFDTTGVFSNDIVVENSDNNAKIIDHYTNDNNDIQSTQSGDSAPSATRERKKSVHFSRDVAYSGQECGDYCDGGGQSTDVANLVKDENLSVVARVDQNNSSDRIDAPVTSPTDQNNSSDPNAQGNIGFFNTAMTDEDLDAITLKTRGVAEQNIFYMDESHLNAKEIIRKTSTDHFTKALSLQESKHFVDSLTYLNKAMKLSPNNPEHYIARAEIYIEMTDFASAILNYKRACFLLPDIKIHYNRLTFLFYLHGQLLYDQGLYAEALEAYTRAVEMDPSNMGFHTRSIACLTALGRHSECLALVNKRLEKDDACADLYILRARLHTMFKNLTLCYYDIKDALAIDPAHEEGQLMATRLQMRSEECRLDAVQNSLLGKNREALQKISTAIELNPEKADFHVFRGAVHRKMSDYNAAIDDYLLALDKVDHDEDTAVYSDCQRQLLLTYNDFAVDCFTQAYYDEAIILLNKALKAEKHEKGLYINRGDCFFRQGESTFALQDYHQALELDPRDENVRARLSVIHNDLGTEAYQQKNFIESEAKFTMAIQYNPHVGQYYFSRGRARYLLEDVPGARHDVITGLLLDPSNPEVLSILARLFPGKSVADLLNSPMAIKSRDAINNLVPRASPVYLPSVPSSASVSPEARMFSERRALISSPTKLQKKIQISLPESPAQRLVVSDTATVFRLCPLEHRLNASLVKEKRRKFWIWAQSHSVDCVNLLSNDHPENVCPVCHGNTDKTGHLTEQIFTHLKEFNKAMAITLKPHKKCDDSDQLNTQTHNIAKHSAKQSQRRWSRKMATSSARQFKSEKSDYRKILYVFNRAGKIIRPVLSFNDLLKEDITRTGKNRVQSDSVHQGNDDMAPVLAQSHAQIQAEEKLSPRTENFYDVLYSERGRKHLIGKAALHRKYSAN